MLTKKGNIFFEPCDALCITTNGSFNKNTKAAVMGRGCALQLAQLIPDIKFVLGRLILRNGNRVQLMARGTEKDYVAFPVKPSWREYCVPQDVVKHKRDDFKVGQIIPGWASTAIPQIIRQSAFELVTLADYYGWKKVVLPYAGCGAGELNWEAEVKPLLEAILDDRFIAMTF